MENMMNRLFPHINPDENTENQQEFFEPSNHCAVERNTNSSNNDETRACANCQRKFKTARGLTQHLRKCKQTETTTTEICTQIATPQTSACEETIWGNLSLYNHTTSCDFNLWRGSKMEEKHLYVALRKDWESVHRWVYSFDTWMGKRRSARSNCDQMFNDNADIITSKK